MSHQGGEPGWAAMVFHGMPGVGKTAMARSIAAKLPVGRLGARIYLDCQDLRDDGSIPAHHAIRKRILTKLEIPEEELEGADEALCRRLLRTKLPRSGNVI